MNLPKVGIKMLTTFLSLKILSSTKILLLILSTECEITQKNFFQILQGEASDSLLQTNEIS